MEGLFQLELKLSKPEKMEKETNTSPRSSPDLLQSLPKGKGQGQQGEQGGDLVANKDTISDQHHHDKDRMKKTISPPLPQSRSPVHTNGDTANHSTSMDSNPHQNQHHRHVDSMNHASAVKR
jgi:hypothetical protein